MATSPEKITRPIGVFDSGLGGLSVVRHIRRALPHESVCYFADSAHAPYGEKTPAFIRERATFCTQFLIEQGAKAIVVGCNTATAAAAAHLRSQFDLPIVAMEPAVKPAAAASRRGVIGVLATTGTLKSAQFAALLDTWGQHVKVITRAGTGLVECVERGELDTPATRELVARHVAPLIEGGADAIVLGCTHYPFLREAIAAAAGPEVALIDTGDAVARQVMRVLHEAQLAHPGPAGEDRFWTTGNTDLARDVTRTLWKDAPWHAA